MRRIVCLLVLLALTPGPERGWAASSPGGGRAELGKSNHTAGIVAAGVAGAVIVGGLLWWQFHRSPGLGGNVTTRKPQGAAPVLVIGEFQDGNPMAEKARLSKRVRGLLVDALKRSQAYALQEVSTGSPPRDSAMVLTAKVSSLANFSQADVAVSRKGEVDFTQTMTWFDESELRKQVVQLVNQITEKVK